MGNARTKTAPPEIFNSVISKLAGMQSKKNKNKELNRQPIISPPENGNSNTIKTSYVNGKQKEDNQKKDLDKQSKAPQNLNLAPVILNLISNQNGVEQNKNLNKQSKISENLNVAKISYINKKQTEIEQNKELNNHTKT